MHETCASLRTSQRHSMSTCTPDSPPTDRIQEDRYKVGVRFCLNHGRGSTQVSLHSLPPTQTLRSYVARPCFQKQQTSPESLLLSNIITLKTYTAQYLKRIFLGRLMGRKRIILYIPHGLNDFKTNNPVNSKVQNLPNAISI